MTPRSLDDAACDIEFPLINHGCARQSGVDIVGREYGAWLQCAGNASMRIKEDNTWSDRGRECVSE